jgi:hypothetical protein
VATIVPNLKRLKDKVERLKDYISKPANSPLITNTKI